MSNNVYGIFLCLIIVCNVIISVRAESRIDFGACETPDKTSGLCLRLVDCGHIYDLILNGTKSPDKNFLMQSQCGIDNTQNDLPKRVLVCCPTEFCNTKLDPIDSKNLPSNVLPRAGVCGQIFLNKIYGGKETLIDEFPWLVLLKYLKAKNVESFDCTGSLINKQYVLTAAHCVKSESIPSVAQITHVRLGEHNLATAPDCIVDVNKRRHCAPLHIDVPVESIIPHEDYIPNTKDQFNDIALIRMKERIDFTNFVRPICLPVANELKDRIKIDSVMEIAGWGFTERLSPSNVKLKASVKVWPFNKCQHSYAQFGITVSNTQLCAGGEQKVDTCRGDSGGPLMTTEIVGDRVIAFAAGIVSYGPKPCAILDWPGVYTKVESFIPWIQNHLEP